MLEFKQFFALLIEANAHSQENLDSAFEKAWKRHGPDIMEAFKTGKNQYAGGKILSHGSMESHPIVKAALNSEMSNWVDDLQSGRKTTHEYSEHEYEPDDYEQQYPLRSYKTKESEPADLIKDQLKWLTQNSVRRDYELNGQMMERPQLRPHETAMPGSGPKYMDWILKQMKIGNIKDLGDVGTTIRSDLEKYDHLKRHNLLRADITNKPKKQRGQDYDSNDPVWSDRKEKEYHENAAMASRLPIARKDRNGNYRYDSHASLDFNNVESPSHLHDFLAHPAYADYLRGATHEELVSGLKEGHDYDVIHDSTPGGPHRDKLDKFQQAAGMGVKVIHAKTEEAAAAFSIPPGTNEPCEWCTGVSGLHGGNAQFRYHTSKAPLLVLQGEKGSAKWLADNPDEIVDDRPAIRQVNVGTNEWMDELNSHDPRLDAKRPEYHAFPSFTGNHIRAASAAIMMKKLKHLPSSYDFVDEPKRVDRYDRPVLSEIGNQFRSDWHLWRRHGNSDEYRDRLANSSGMDAVIEHNRRVAKFANMTPEQTDNFDAMFGRAETENRSHLILRHQDSPDPISHVTKRLIAQYGSTSDISHLTANKPVNGKFSRFPLHDFDDHTIRAIMNSASRSPQYHDYTTKKPAENEVIQGRMLARFASHPVMQELTKHWDAHYRVLRLKDNDLPGFYGSI